MCSLRSHDGPKRDHLGSGTAMADGVILVVEDEQNIAKLVSLYLGNEGYAVEHVADGADALDAVRRVEPDLVVLDLMLPGVDGIELCRRIRADGRLPVIMLTARDQEVDRVLGLEIGADDYITKPFSPRELVARVKAVLRRAAPPAEEEAAALSLGAIRIDRARRRVGVEGREVTLTAKEFDLLAYLVHNAGIVFSRDRLLERVWGYERAVGTRTVDSHVKSLRAKLGDAGRHIHTVRGVGYKADAARGG